MLTKTVCPLALDLGAFAKAVNFAVVAVVYEVSYKVGIAVHIHITDVFMVLLICFSAISKQRSTPGVDALLIGRSKYRGAVLGVLRQTAFIETQSDRGIQVSINNFVSFASDGLEYCVAQDWPSVHCFVGATTATIHRIDGKPLEFRNRRFGWEGYHSAHLR